MPDLTTTIHLDMLREHKERNSFFDRVRRAAQAFADPLYGLEWGNPENVPPLAFIRDRWVRPYRNLQHTALEIGPGGGRWTRYLIEFRKVYLVDYHAELLRELERNFHRPHMQFIKNNGTDFPGVPDRSIDFLFSFGCFVHLDPEIIEEYLRQMRRILKPGGNAVLHYSDQTKIMARENPGFSDNDPKRMRAMVNRQRFQIVEEDLTTLWHSSLIRFTL